MATAEFAAQAEFSDHRDAASTCLHCGLPIRSAAECVDGAFCCSGCSSVYRVIHDEGFAGYYDLLETREQPLDAPPVPTAADFAEFDDPAFHEHYVTTIDATHRSCSLQIDALHCAACVWLLERLPRTVDGWLAARVDIGRHRVRVDWDRERTSLSTIARQFDRLGYTPHAIRQLGGDGDGLALREQRRMLMRIGVAGAAFGNVMLMAFAMYGGAIDGMAAEHARLFRWASLVVTLPAVLYSALPFYRGAFAAIRLRTVHMDLPIVIGLTAGFVGGVVNTIREAGDVYYDSVTALIFLLLVGRFLEQRGQRRAVEKAQLLRALTPPCARRVVAGGRDIDDADAGLQQVPLEALVVGDVVEVRDGELIPVDGRVVVGQSRIDNALLTGESEPVRVGIGDTVNAGAANIGSQLRIEAEAVGSRTRVGRLVENVERHLADRTRVVALADRTAAVFVVGVIALALVTAIVWMNLEPGVVLDRVMALLVVTCPCALGLATPLAVSSAIGRAAAHGVLIKSGDVFERLATPGRVWFDKTGTLTVGRPEVVTWVATAAAPGDDEGLVDRVASLERGLAHPIARALTARGRPHCTVSNAESIAGRGVFGNVDGHDLLVGSPQFAREHLAGRRGASDVDPLSGDVAARIAALRDGRQSVVVAVEDGRAVAVIGLRDRVRRDAKRLVGRLRECGWQVGMLSGDSAPVVTRIAQELGIPASEALAELSPEEKLERVRTDLGGQPVVMIGDGVNDAAALAAADVGLSLRGGAEVALAAADAYIAGGPSGSAEARLSVMGDLFDAARRTLSVIRRNVAFSIVYNAIGASLAIVGWIGPMTAAILMPLSSLTVTTHSYVADVFCDSEERGDRTR